MRIDGWIMMLVSIGSVLSLVIFCLIRVLTLPPGEVESLNTALLEQDTRDTLDPD
jgi:hypothetical protein